MEDCRLSVTSGAPSEPPLLVVVGTTAISTGTLMSKVFGLNDTTETYSILPPVTLLCNVVTDD
jgi:hypothetical protein